MGHDFSATRNACKLCMPLGASLVFKGIEGAMPFLHGSQGCSTYIRRYLISHFREPVDIASSNFSEETAVFGGGANLQQGLSNIIEQYHPSMIGVATTCLAETIGDDVRAHLRAFREIAGDGAPPVLNVSTPSYAASHAEGFTAATRAVVEQIVPAGSAYSKEGAVNIFPNMISPEDLRHLKGILTSMGLPFIMLPDYADTLDGPSWSDHQLIPPGGTPLSEIKKMGASRASISLGRSTGARSSMTAAHYLEQNSGVPAYYLGMPVGLRETDSFFAVLEEISGRSVPEKYIQERGRLVDSFVDGHKYVSGKRAIVYGEEDLVIALASFLSETGIVPVLCASGGESKHLKEEVRKVLARPMDVKILEGADFADIDELAEKMSPDLVIGNSKGYTLSRKLKIPLVRVGFPIHDRIGAQRILHCGYRGALALYDKIVNSLMDAKQEDSPVGYSYL